MVLKAILVSVFALSVAAAPYLDARVDAVCSRGIYGELTPILQSYPIALALCSAAYPVSCTSAQKVRRQASSTRPSLTTTTTTTTSKTTTITTTSSLISSSLDAKASAWSKLQQQAVSVISTLCSCIEIPTTCSTTSSKTTTTTTFRPTTSTTSSSIRTSTTSATVSPTSSRITTTSSRSSTISATITSNTIRSSTSSTSRISTTSTGSTSTTSKTSTTFDSSITSSRTTTTTGTLTTTTTETKDAAQTPAYYFKAYGNGYITDGTTLGDAGGSAIFDGSSTPFYVNSSGFLIDIQTGGIGAINSGSGSNINFVSEKSLGGYQRCDCSVAGGDSLSCNCGGSSGFSAGSDGRLLIGPAPAKKRSPLAFWQNHNKRQAASSVQVSAQTTAVGTGNVGGATSTLEPTTMYTTSCGSSTSYTSLGPGSTGTLVIGSCARKPVPTPITITSTSIVSSCGSSTSTTVVAPGSTRTAVVGSCAYIATSTLTITTVGNLR